MSCYFEHLSSVFEPLFASQALFLKALSGTAATKFLSQTRSGSSMSPEEERKRLLEMEAEFYGQFWQSATSSEDFGDVFEALDVEKPPEPDVVSRSFSEGAFRVESEMVSACAFARV